MVSKTQLEIEAAASEAVRVIANAAGEAAKVVAAAAGEAVKVANIKGSEDHDLLIKLSEQIRRLSADVKDLKDGTSQKIVDLEHDKADKKEFDNFRDKDFKSLKDDVYTSREKRIRSLENKVANFWVAISLYSAAVIGMIALICFHIFK